MMIGPFSLALVFTILLGLSSEIASSSDGTYCAEYAESSSDVCVEGEINFCEGEHSFFASNVTTWSYDEKPEGKRDWYYVLFPCDLTNYEHFPLFLMQEHTKTKSKTSSSTKSKKSSKTSSKCTNNGANGRTRLILNTKPQPWEIEWYKSSITVQRGTDVINDDIEFDESVHNSPETALVFNYDDGVAFPAQKGTVQIYYEDKRMHVELIDVQYDAFPRSCNKNQGRGELLECGTDVMQGTALYLESMKDQFLKISGLNGFRNIGCGVLGKYYRGDCTSSQFEDIQDDCSKILESPGADGTTYFEATHDGFQSFVPSWKVGNVEQTIEDYLVV